MSKKPTKFRHLAAWDHMMGSSNSWREMMQERAEADGAPIDAIYRKDDGSWATFGDTRSENTKHIIERILANLN